jgi:hypothetical protein
MTHNLPPTAVKEVKRVFRGHPEPRQGTSSPAPLIYEQTSEEVTSHFCRFFLTL